MAGCHGLIRSGNRSIIVRRAASCCRSPRSTRCGTVARGPGCAFSTTATSGRVAVRLRRLGQEGVDLPRVPRRKRRFDGRRWDEYLPGGTLGREMGARRPLGEDVRQLAHRIVQGSGMTVLVSVVKQMIADGRSHRRRLRVDRRHVGGPRRLRGGRRHSGDGHSAARGFRRRSSSSRSPTAHCARARHRLRRLHGDRPAAGRGRSVYLANSMNASGIEGQKSCRSKSSSVDWEVPTSSSCPRQPRQRRRDRRRVRDDAGPRADPQAPADRRRAGRGRQSAVRGLPIEPGIRADEAKPTLATRHPDRQPGVDPQGYPGAQALRRRRRAGERERAGRGRRARRSHRMFNCPHTAWRSRAREARRARRDQEHGPRRASRPPTA